jgi:hypothetical protein
MLTFSLILFPAAHNFSIVPGHPLEGKESTARRKTKLIGRVEMKKILSSGNRDMEIGLQKFVFF